MSLVGSAGMTVAGPIEDIVDQAWVEDPTTGAQWRVLTPDELSAVGRGGAPSGFVIRDSNQALADFRGAATKTLNIVMDGRVETLNFSLQDTLAIVVGTLPVIPLSLATSASGLDDILDADVRHYKAATMNASLTHVQLTRPSTGGHGPSTAAPQDQLAGVVQLHGYQYEILGPSQHLGYLGSEHFFTIFAGCAPGLTEAWLAAPVPVTALMQAAEPGWDGCPMPIPRVDLGRTPSTTKVVTLGTVGEIDFCTENDEPFALMAESVERSKDLFADTSASLTYLWASCWIMDGAREYDHDGDALIHVHSPSWTGDYHAWEFNNVPASHPILSVGYDHGYMDVDCVLDGIACSARSDTEGHTGILGLEKHLGQHYADFNDADIVQLFHKDTMPNEHEPGRTLCGMADLPGSKNVICGDGAEDHRAGHEIGHSLNANHCDAEELTISGETRYTAMAEPDPSCNMAGANWNVLSDDNWAGVNSHVTATY